MREKQITLYDIYDPSSSVSGSYWQLGTANKTINKEEWQKVSGYINQGLPVREDELFRCKSPEMKHELWGCLHLQDSYWVYRHFLTGYDNFNRPGRYFFVLFKLESLTALRNPLMSNILRHLAGQTTIPLDLQSLKSQSISTTVGSMADQLFPINPVAVSEQNLTKIEELISKIPVNEHHAWVIRQCNILRKYLNLNTDIPTYKKPSPPPVVDEESGVASKSPFDGTPQKKPADIAAQPTSRVIKDTPRQGQYHSSRPSSISYAAGLITIGLLIGLIVGAIVGFYTRPTSPQPQPSKPKFLVKVVNGTGTGTYEVGATVEIDPILSRDKFIGWEGDTQFLVKSDKQERQIDKMPASDIQIRAKYNIFWLSYFYDKDGISVKLESMGDPPNNIVWEVDKNKINPSASNLQ